MILNILPAMKTLTFQHFLKVIFKKAKSSFIIKWFNR